MDNNHSTSQHSEAMDAKQTKKGLTAANMVLVCFLAIVGFFLLMEHRAHLYGALPWLILALCPLMHIFMHRGHGGHNHSSDEN